MKKLLAILCACLMLLSLAGCTSEDEGEFPVTLANCTIQSKPNSVLCLSDSVADILIACGYADRITARSDECTQPELSSLPSVGSKDHPRVSSVKDMDPDIVFADKTLSDDAYQKLTENGRIVLIMMPAKNKEELTKLYENICSAVDGKKRGKENGSERVNSILMTMSDLQRIVPKKNTVTTACYLYDITGSAANEKSFSGRLFEYTNATNIFASSTGNEDKLQKLSLENPDFIFCASGLRSQLEADSQLKNLRAVKNKNIYEIDPLVFDRQGNSMTEVISYMIEVMYPELKKPHPTEEASQQSSNEESSAQESSDEEAPEESSEEEASVPESSHTPPVRVITADTSLEITDGLAYGIGEEHDDVKKIQQRLHSLGYFEEDVTGYYGNVTSESFRKFEEANNLETDGLASTEDLRLLFSADVIPAA